MLFIGDGNCVVELIVGMLDLMVMAVEVVAKTVSGFLVHTV